MSRFESLSSAIRDFRWKPAVILFAATLLALSWRYFGSRGAFAGPLASVMPAETDLPLAAAVYQFVACFALLGLIPAVIVRGGFRERLRDYGLRPGDLRRSVGSFLVLAPLFVVASYFAAGRPEIAAVFPINPRAGDSAGMFALHGATYLLFYLGWEFCFRGFMLFGLRDSLGAANAVLVQTMASTLLHIGGPTPEAYGAIIGGILWGTLALWSRSLLSGLGQHYVLGISLDYFLSFGSS